MKLRELSVNKACIFLGILLLAAVGTVSATLYTLTHNITAVWYVVLFSIFVFAVRHLFCGSDSPQAGPVF